MALPHAVVVSGCVAGKSTLLNQVTVIIIKMVFITLISKTNDSLTLPLRILMTLRGVFRTLREKKVFSLTRSKIFQSGRCLSVEWRAASFYHWVERFIKQRAWHEIIRRNINIELFLLVSGILSLKVWSRPKTDFHGERATLKKHRFISPARRYARILKVSGSGSLKRVYEDILTGYRGKVRHLGRRCANSGCIFWAISAGHFL